ncbi:ATP-binding protein [Spirosoma agri]|uniref:histidine kinase n=1 Tax=Spirosoma agri TaxID=1987381 RepID=A0A6M0IIX8_9BACT|nr:ATP-binding protein [Spirosoma agri]NEU68240.1 histidine kinase [Spirosoma agri]
MKQLDQQVARRLTRFYVLALTTIAVLVVSGLLFIRHTISTHYDDSRVVNVTGRQRMLSQRLTKLALLKITGLPAADTVSFDSLLHTWHQTHLQLRSGLLAMEKTYTVRKSRQLDSMFTRIDPVFNSIYRSFARINDAQATQAQKKEALQVILRDELSFVQQMNDIVFQFDSESFEQVRYLEQIEWGLTLATLLTLLIEALFVFRPVVRYTKNIVWQLAQSENDLQLANVHMERTNHELELTNQHLAATNHKLVDTQQELLRTTEEKYQLQLAEETIRLAALIEGQEEERRRFARELHDGIGQMLTGLKLHAETMKSIKFADEKQRLRFEELCQLIYDIIQTTRQISHNLMPSVLGDFGLGATLQLLADQTMRSSGINVIFDGNREAKRLNPSTEIGLYRIAQEALNNAIKYADAQTIRISLQQNTRKLDLAVIDDGRGFTVKAVRTESGQLSVINGLETMRTRTRLLNGTLTITSKPKKGTKVVVNMALADNRQ